MIVVLMGVSGSGKTTVGEKLAGQLGWPFYDADDFHPQANIDKMHRGEALDDADREPWLAALCRLIDGAEARGEDIILACSALKHAYQDYLRHDLSDVDFVFLHGSPALIQERLAARAHHFMNPNLLPSQLDTLEPPDHAIAVEIDRSPEEIAAEVRRRLKL